MTLTAWLTARRDAAGVTWLAGSRHAHARWVKTTAERKARHRLEAWDSLLTLWVDLTHRTR